MRCVSVGLLVPVICYLYVWHIIIHGARNNTIRLSRAQLYYCIIRIMYCILYNTYYVLSYPGPVATYIQYSYTRALRNLGPGVYMYMYAPFLIGWRSKLVQIRQCVTKLISVSYMLLQNVTISYIFLLNGRDRFLMTRFLNARV